MTSLYAFTRKNNAAVLNKYSGYVDLGETALFSNPTASTDFFRNFLISSAEKPPPRRTWKRRSDYLLKMFLAPHGVVALLENMRNIRFMVIERWHWVSLLSRAFSAGAIQERIIFIRMGAVSAM